MDFFLRRLVLQRCRSVTLKIWDVGGTAQNGNMLDKYVFGSNVRLIMINEVDKLLEVSNINKINF